MKTRYYIDERVGCFAVRDRLLDSDDEPGLHPDTTGVVCFWDGWPKYKTCPTCGHVTRDGWEFRPEDLAKADELLAELNAEETALDTDSAKE